jgi:huntingtin-interacting protein 1-related protein
MIEQGADQVSAISATNSVSHAVAQLLLNAKGVTRLAITDETVDQIVYGVKSGANSTKYLLDQMKSHALLQVEAERRSTHIAQLTQQVLHELASMTALFEHLVPEEVSIGLTKVEDIEELVEREMKNAAKAIQDAARRLDALLGKDLTVHSSIINAAKSLTDAVMLLIQRATDSQHEIVAHGRGTTSSGQFYKKNNKWTEGLISAAKAVAVATTYLVECADGLVSGTYSLEQLIVAAQEVSVATTQLVAAARVKAIPYSKTQDRLEEAAVMVREATKQLVRAAKEASKIHSEQRIQTEIADMNRHQFKVAEMEQQVRVLEIEKELQNARYKLAAIRKSGYTDREEYE